MYASFVLFEFNKRTVKHSLTKPPREIKEKYKIISVDTVGLLALCSQYQCLSESVLVEGCQVAPFYVLPALSIRTAFPYNVSFSMPVTAVG